MIPILYSSSETAFTSNGLGALSDAIRCDVSEEKNGVFELELDYPLNGIHFSEILNGCFIFAMPGDNLDPQPFEVYKRSAPLDETVTFYAQHISYRLKNIPVSAFTANSATEAMAALSANSLETNPFTFSTTVTSTETTTITSSVPRTCRDALGGSSNSILTVYGGELYFDKFNVELKASRSTSSIYPRIAYSKNLSKLKDDLDDSEIITGILPYWSKEVDGEQKLVTGTIVRASSNSYSYNKTTVVDFSSSFTDAPTTDELNEVAQTYLDEKCSSVAKESITISFVALWETEEYKNVACLERVQLCDYVIVEYPKLDMNVTKQVVSVEFDVLAERYLSITLSDESVDSQTSLANTITSISDDNKTNNAQTFSFIEKALDKAGQSIRGGNGGYVIISKDGLNKNREIVVGNADSIESMTKCIRINQNGIGFSNGYNGTMNVAILMNGEIDGKYIQAGSIESSAIHSGAITVDKIDETAQSQLVEGVSESIDNLAAEVNTQTSNGNLKDYVKITSGQIDIGGSKTGTIMRLKNDKASFIDSSDKDLAYIGDKRFYSLAVQIGKFMYADDDGLVVRWIGD